MACDGVAGVPAQRAVILSSDRSPKERRGRRKRGESRNNERYDSLGS